MYIFKPVSDIKKLKEIFNDDVNGGYIGYEGDTVIGKCSLLVDGYKVTVKSIEFDKEAFYVKKKISENNCSLHCGSGTDEWLWWKRKERCQ